MSHRNPCFVYIWYKNNFFIFIIDQVVVLNEVQALDKLVRYSVPNLHIGSTGWKVSSQNIAGQGVLYF